MIIFVLPNNHTMENPDLKSNVSKEELVFNDLMLHGDDFMKIHIYRSAKEWYTRALESNFNNELAKSKLAECNAMLKSESKAIVLIVSILALIAVVIIIAV